MDASKKSIVVEPSPPYLPFARNVTSTAETVRPDNGDTSNLKKLFVPPRVISSNNIEIDGAMDII